MGPHHSPSTHWVMSPDLTPEMGETWREYTRSVGGRHGLCLGSCPSLVKRQNYVLQRILCKKRSCEVISQASLAHVASWRVIP